MIIVAACSFLFALMLPDKEIKGHKVDSFTAIWPYRDLVVDHDFLISKTPAEIKEEKDQIKKAAPLFFEVNNTERNNKLVKLQHLDLVDAQAYKILKPLFDSIYKRGVIETLDEDSRKKAIFITIGSYAEPAVYYDYFTIQTAVEYLSRNINSDLIDKNYLDYLTINYLLNKEKTNLYISSKLEQLSLYKNIIKEGQTLVKESEPLTNSKRYLINRYFNAQNKNASFSFVRFMAKWGLTYIISMVLLVFLAFFRKQIFGQNKQVAFLFLLMLGSVYFSFFFHKYGLMLFALPFALVPIMVRVFFDGRTALFTYLMILLLCSFFMADRLEFILLQLIPGIGTLFVVAEMRRRQQILNAALLVFLFYVLIFVTYQLSFGTPETVMKFSSYIPFAISAMLVLLAYPLIFLTERFFGFISDFKLLELSDLNHPLLRRLSKDVPGTFQHSLQVANLAEEAIYYIGGNSLLVRTGAMYHDIGKLENPYFFTENQPDGFSPHQEIDPIESARIIINHVILGVEMAKKYKLPEQIIDFIRTHHGTTSVSYFLNLFRKQGHDSKIAESQFRYPGPIPFSKETAVLMIADGVEAASRSLKNHDALTINDLVDNIIDYKIANNQFINSDITFKDITTIKKIFKKRLMNIYHARIEYPS
ncbi:HD family phosphohydrolase [Aurantibacillus circumpalustris]|uniref:HD family phosphohydrolase n=1 Tax=Aurantibacillus circumpalustris TaxID=3036359 RepID=UPI00295B4E68|nr:HDIG domain-containing metalloprotein [Aurantibacillus circumpalustris]